jgi:hypothetical protein
MKNHKKKEKKKQVKEVEGKASPVTGRGGP